MMIDGGEGKGEAEGEMKEVPEARKKALRDSETSMSDSEDEDEDAGGQGKGKGRPKLSTLQRIRRDMKDVSNSFSKSFMDYGPPYYDDPDRESLIDVCAQGVVNVINVHSILNQKADPNERDPEDFYFTAMHYCARNGNLLVMRMLRRAGGEVNILNEFGQSPLTMCCIQVSTKDKIETQNKMCIWLINQGADIHMRDRAGLEPLDYCAMNNDLEKIKILLARGAKVRRENFMLKSAPRKGLLKQTTDPECYRVLNEALQVETAGFNERESIRKAEKDELEHEKAVMKNLLTLKKKKEMKAENKKKAIEYERLVAKLEARKKNVADSMEWLTGAKKANAKEQGEYVRDDMGNWTWESKDKLETADAKSHNIYAASTAALARLRDKNKLSTFQERWAKMGGEGELEMEWTRDIQFYREGEEREAQPRRGEADDEDDESELDEEEEKEAKEMADLLDGDSLEDLLG